MEKKDFIQKSIEGGWYWTMPDYPEDKMKIYTKENMQAPAVAMFTDGEFNFVITLEQALLDPKAWQAVGKVEGWKEKTGLMAEPQHIEIQEYMLKMHQMIDALCEGISLEEFIKTL